MTHHPTPANSQPWTGEDLAELRAEYDTIASAFLAWFEDTDSRYDALLERSTALRERALALGGHPETASAQWAALDALGLPAGGFLRSGLTDSAFEQVGRVQFVQDRLAVQHAAVEDLAASGDPDRVRIAGKIARLTVDEVGMLDGFVDELIGDEAAG